MCVVRFNVVRARVPSRKRYDRCGFSLETVVVFVAVVVAFHSGKVSEFN